MQSQTDYAISELGERLKKGDRSVIGDLFQAYSDLTIMQSRRARAMMPWKTDDILGVVREALMVALNRIPTIDYHGEIGGYLRQAVTYAVCAFLRNDHLVPVPIAAYKKGYTAELRDIAGFDLPSEQPTLTERDIYEVAQDDEIVSMIAESATRSEMAAAIGESERQIRKRIAAIRKRLKDVL